MAPPAAPHLAGPVWLVEDGIGETRAVLVPQDGITNGAPCYGEPIAARLDWPDTGGAARAGAVVQARLIHRAGGARRGVVRLEDGQEALVDQLPREASEGAPIRVRITREAIAETGRLKQAHTRPTDDPLAPAPPLAEQLRATGLPVRVVHHMPAGLWEGVWDDALSGQIGFAGGSLIVSPTPAMTLIDVDGALPPRALALAAAQAAAEAILRLDLAGSIGIDFPTLEAKADRQAVDATLAAALLEGALPYVHERTAMNGFGFVQIVARMERPSLPARMRRDPLGAAARMLLRRAERVEGAGVLLITCPPALRARITPAWEADLARRSGRALDWRLDDSLALAGGFAQAVAR
ncbi:ribonuclease [Novosphingobium sp. FSY-8]|uniref:Ribonuclease n=1 Tax=Novosphingobium ovatum TaxID=1908523 RepID=A0ABW9XAU3_9SPHN|nr:ribonuclease [Novosphingobium ovatum]NBC35654.1 ribonuclease [Novosphingobium ovatum]